MGRREKALGTGWIAATLMICFTPAGAALGGKVTDAAGNPLKGARISLVVSKQSTYTDANGRYAFNPVSVHASRAVHPGTALAVDLGDGFLFVRAHGQAFALDGSRLPDATRSAPLPPHLAKAAAATAAPAAPAADSLEVIAVGFERGARGIPEADGVQDFKLNPVKWSGIPYKSGTLNATEKSYCNLDVHRPSSGSRWPVILHFHGGGLVEGDRNEGWTSYHNNFAWKFLDAGYMMVMPDYRLIGKGGTFPDYLRDAAAAADWVRRNIETYGGDPENVFVGGWSAGAYLTTMLLLDTAWFRALGRDVRDFRGFIALSGQTRQHANLAGDLKVQDIFSERPAAVPMGHVRRIDIPFQIFVGSKEGGTVTDNKELYDKLLAAGSANLLYNVIPDHAHNDMGNFMGNATDETRTRYLAFLAKYRKP